MKRALLAVLSGVLLCGCGNKSQDAKIEILSKQVDLLIKDQWVIYTNDAIILKSIDDLKIKESNAANNDLYYFTNLLIGLGAQSGRVENNVLVVATNLNQVHEDVVKLKLKLGITD